MITCTTLKTYKKYFLKIREVNIAIEDTLMIPFPRVVNIWNKFVLMPQLHR